MMMMMSLVIEDCKNAINFGCKNHPNMNCMLCDFFEQKEIKSGITTCSNTEDNSWIVVSTTNKVEEVRRS